MIEDLTKKSDERGTLIELFKLPGVGQVFYSTTKPGYTRGNHYHLRKIERFCVIGGSGEITLRDRVSGEIKSVLVSGEKPQVVDMPINWAHNIKNVGDKEMKLIIWVNEVFDPKNSDTYPEQV